MKTRTGQFPIGFRYGGSEWQQDLPALVKWAQSHELEVMDIGRTADVDGKVVQEGGLRIGTVDLRAWQPMISPDRGRRAEAIAQNNEYIRACAAYGVVNHFVVMLPEDAARPRQENFGYMVESFAQLAPALEASNAHIAIEGWPGPGALCCTPEAYRAFFKEVSSKSMGVNYDPSHLIRMGIDPLRFLREFADRVVHVHGKDTELLAENQYEFGTEQPATFAKPIRYGGFAWRYTIPGHGVTRWTEVLRILESNGYRGCVSIELEDANFHGTADAEQMGIVQGALFLRGC
jgi:sugar phosphate isomerase/epimerase